MILEGKLEEVTTLLQSAPADGALATSVEIATELVREAQAELGPLPPNPYTDALVDFGEALLELLEQFRS